MRAIANTVYARRGVLSDGLTAPQDLTAWLVAHRGHFQAAVDLHAAGQRLDEVRALRDALREPFATVVEDEPPADAAIATLNRLRSRADRRSATRA